jgi:hypothetical protein
MELPENRRDLHLYITEHIFTNSPTMLALCLTIIGLIKIYTALQRVTTLADNFLALALVAFLLATISSYLALRATVHRRRVLMARIADAMFLSGLTAATAVALFVAFSLAD